VITGRCCARREALAAEEYDRRLEDRRQQWYRDGAYLTWAELEAGEPCRGCGQPLLDGLGNWGPLNGLTPERRAEYDREEALFRERQNMPVASLEPYRPPGHAMRVLLPAASHE
jgi:hypothetical protein